MLFNTRPFGKTDFINHTPFIQYWDGENINPPPPETMVMITESGIEMITEITDSLMITE